MKLYLEACIKEKTRIMRYAESDVERYEEDLKNINIESYLPLVEGVEIYEKDTVDV